MARKTNKRVDSKGKIDALRRHMVKKVVQTFMKLIGSNLVKEGGSNMVKTGNLLEPRGF